MRARQLDDARQRGEQVQDGLPTSPGAPRADVPLDDNAALRDLMDGAT